MIEFKAECGHTVRAKDEDAGGMVRCSYCGQSAAVPDEQGDSLDFLFDDADEKGETIATKRKRRPRPGTRPKRARRPGEFNPFPIVVKLIYAAVLISIVIYVGKTWVLPLIREGGVVARSNDGSQPPIKRLTREERNANRPRTPRTNRPGFIAREKLSGLFVKPTPPGASVYYIPQSKAPDEGRIQGLPGTLQIRSDVNFPIVGDDSYVVEVVFPWNHPSLTTYRNYTEFRRAISEASDRQRRRLLEEYFIPDEASDFFVAQTPEQIFLVRQYRDVLVRNKRTKGVRALFLPRIVTSDDDESFSIEELVANYIPKTDAYFFDEKHVLNELEFYGVLASDQSFVVRALERIGVIPYRTPDGRIRLFKIGLEDGSFAVKILDGGG